MTIGNVHLVSHPPVQHKLSLMREKDRSTKGFRELLNEIGMAAAKADVSIIPSMLMLSTPARSLTISPMPASSSGVARRIDEPRKTANSSQLIAAPISR